MELIKDTLSRIKPVNADLLQQAQVMGESWAI